MPSIDITNLVGDDLFEALSSGASIEIELPSKAGKPAVFAKVIAGFTGHGRVPCS